MRTVSWRILAFLLPLTAYCQGAGTSTITVGVGGGFPAGGYLTDSFSNVSSFSGNFEFRLHQYAAVEVGVENFLADFQNFSRGGEFTTRERVTFLPLGLRGVLPLGQGRIELFLGGCGARV